MYNSIINPLWFYLIDICTHLTAINIVVMSFSGVSLSFISTFLVLNRPSKGNIDVESFKAIKLMFKKLTIIFIISTLLFTFIPSKTSLLEMLTMSQITPYNVDNVDYIFEKIENITKE